MLTEWSTDSVPAATRFDEWREACCEHVYALTPQRQPAVHPRPPFHGAIARRHLGALDVTDIVCDGHLVQRREQDIDECPGDTYYVYLQRQGRAWFEQQGQRCVAEAGDIVIADPNLAFRTGTDGVFDFRLWRIERARLHPLLALRSGERLPMHHIDRAHTERELIANWLDGLLRHHAGLSATSRDMALGTLCALVAGAVGAGPDQHEPTRLARRRALLLRVQQQVEQRSSEMDLTPERVARAFGVSLRTLHQLFALSDGSFHEYLTRARLTRAHALLRDPASRHLGTAEIGFAAGFGEVSTFYRRFKQRYGVAPGEFRAG
ncbi:MAG: helix-turn-helix domain-containing protein [Hydrogenophaga sp.]|jgi:AraC-like DNA-binding protein|uniref:helix-turn-helix domain-containing protein n=1 Tax=unclassified Hydrogenophaga TaxID=2610897 RepID=UPI0036D38FB4